jgi:hypothetical protein
MLDVLDMQDDVAVAAAAGGGDDVLVEGKRDKDDEDEQVDGGADGAHALGDLDLVRLGHVAALEAGLHEGGAEPADHGVAEGEGEAREGERCDQRLAIALKGVGEHG